MNKMSDDIDIQEPKLDLEINNPKLMNDVPDVCNNEIIEDQKNNIDIDIKYYLKGELMWRDTKNNLISVIELDNKIIR